MLAILVGCEKEYPWDFKPDNISRLVVDGIITNELMPQCIKLSETNQDMNQGFNPVSGAFVSVSDGTIHTISANLKMTKGVIFRRHSGSDKSHL
jgi:hypothetical protein